jgi:hypothetical protein
MFAQDIEFMFKYNNITSFDDLSEAEMLVLLQTVSYLKVNSFTPNHS